MPVEVVVGFPDPGQDDGRRLWQRLLSDIARAMGADLELYDVPTFPVEKVRPARGEAAAAFRDRVPLCAAER
jgi:hypothetical protein